jgi:hypothetical protein
LLLFVCGFVGCVESARRTNQVVCLEDSTHPTEGSELGTTD